MMDTIKFTNFALSQTAIALSPTDTSILVEAGHGSRYPALTGSDFFYVTLENAALVREIVKVTARITDTLTVVRGQDGTTAAAWDAGTPVALRLNAAALEYAMEASRLSAVGAAASAATATTQATNAAASAATATTKAGEASTSATNAAASAATATTQASNAATSATNAAASATTATTQASNAATSATNAATSETNAAASAAAAALFDPSSYYTRAQVDAKIGVSQWSVFEEGGVLFFRHSGVKKAKLESTGKLTVLDDVVAFGTM